MKDPSSGMAHLHPPRPLTARRLRDHFEQMLPDARVIPLDTLSRHGMVGCVDGRNHRCVTGAPGGNAGLLILLLAAWEEISGKALDAAQIDGLFGRYLDQFGSFYLHSDREAEDRYQAAGEALKGHAHPEALLELRLRPEHLGCAHLQGMMEDPVGYGVRPGLARSVLRAFHRRVRLGDPRLVLDILDGEHREEGWVRIHTLPADEAGEGEGPRRPPLPPPTLVTACPRHGELELFVQHPDAVAWLIALHALFLVREGLLPPGRVAAAIETQESLGHRQLQQTRRRMGDGLPVFDVEVTAGDGGAPPRVRSVIPSTPSTPGPPFLPTS